jgi:hypothetical protein
MRGVYLVAAELSRLGFVASPTSRNARGSDILVTDQRCRRTFSIQVKTNATTFGFWLINSQTREMVSPTHFYVFVNLLKDGDEVEYFVVPSKVVGKKMKIDKARTGSVWHSFSYEDAEPFRDRWSLFGKPV